MYLDDSRSHQSTHYARVAGLAGAGDSCPAERIILMDDVVLFLYDVDCPLISSFDSINQGLD